mmetsp:Transcript_33056/g.87739  ORF Transcript_33056/g.87739 Transcript_33056/m.87739 type:complete len:162 (+) Transcript_33056:61-546(+)
MKSGNDDISLLECMKEADFEAIEREVQRVSKDLRVNQSLDPFRVSYEKLHSEFKKSIEREKLLVSKCRELKQEAVANAARVQTALNLAQVDEKAIASLKNEIERAWKLADAFQERARRADEAAGELEAQVARLSRLMERRAGASLDYIMYKFIGCSLLLTA